MILLMILHHYHSSADETTLITLSLTSAGKDVIFLWLWCDALQIKIEVSFDAFLYRLVIFFLRGLRWRFLFFAVIWKRDCNRSPWRTASCRKTAIALQICKGLPLWAPAAQCDRHHSWIGSFSLMQAKNDPTVLLWEILVVSSPNAMRYDSCEGWVCVTYRP